MIIEITPISAILYAITIICSIWGSYNRGFRKGADHALDRVEDILKKKGIMK